MKQFAIILLFALIALPLMAQTVQQGVIQEYNEKAKKTALPGVELTIRSAGSTVSDKKGRFSLNFLTLKPGERVNVRRIEKAGYEIFNKEAVEQWNINPTTPFVIVMCRSDRFKRIRDNYERVSSESYRRQLQKEEAALARQRQEGKLREEEYQRKLYELRENYERQLDNLENYVDRFSRIDLSELTETEREIIGLVQSGRIDEAIARYEQENYVDKYLQQASQLQEVTSAVEQLTAIQQEKQQACADLLAAIDRQIETLQLAGGKENFEKIGSLLKSITYADTTNVKVRLKYIKYLKTQNMYAELGSEACRYLKLAIDPHEKLAGLESLLISQINLQEFALAENTAAELVALINSHTGTTNFSDMEYSMTYSRIGGLYMQCGHPEKAVCYFEKAEAKAPHITSDISVDELNCVLFANIGWAVSSRDIGDEAKAMSIVSGVYDKIEDFIINNHPSAELLGIAKTLTDFAQTLEINDQFDDAAKLFAYTKSIYDEAINDNPARVMPLYAIHRTSEAVLHQKLRENEACERCYNEALECYLKISEGQTTQYESQIKAIYNNLCQLYLNENKYDDAILYARKAFDMVEKKYQEAPQYYRASYRSACVSLARTYENMNEDKLAEYYHKTAFDLDKVIFNEIGDSYRQKSWINSLDLCIFYIQRNMHPEIIESLKRQISLGDVFIDEKSPLYEPLQSLVYFLGKSYSATEQYAEAEKLLNRYVKVKPDKFTGYLELARVYVKIGRHDQARENVHKAVEVDDQCRSDIESDPLLKDLL